MSNGVIDTPNAGAASVTIPGELENSLEKILQYAGLPDDQASVFKAYLHDFDRLKDKSFVDLDSRHLRELILPLFFDIYEKAANKAAVEESVTPLIAMFLNYGYMDETLLNPDQVIALYDTIRAPMRGSKYSTYDCRHWFALIKAKLRDPSFNEHGLDYFDVFREKKKRGEVTEAQRIEYENNVDKRVSHEVNGVLKLGQRLCHGQMAGYFPVLHREMVLKDIKSSLVTPERLEQALDKVLAVDYSAFYRETVCNQTDKGIKNEIVWKAVLPELLLLPTFGFRGVMWQELTGRSKTSPARFLFPIFAAGSLEDMVVDVLARFRWDLDKSMSGSFNKENALGSLTGDYTDYIQFYKKNRDLSPETREKLKNQIDKHRGNYVEIFTMDYQNWINYESKGILRLNKVARDILFKYCPFSGVIRDMLGKQPLFTPLISRFDQLRVQKIKSLESHYNKLKRPGMPLEPDLSDNLAFFKL
ncbi:MAG: hypothetical protein ACM3QZ_04160 [Solirubrobacterales bacterium]